MSRKLYDVLWPVTPKTLEDINANFDALYNAVATVQGAADAPVGGHEILSFTHTDSTKANCARGDLIIGSGTTPKWTRLPKGTLAYVLTMGANEPAWATPAHAVLSATHNDSTAAAVVRGDLIIGSGATPKWTRLAKGTAAYVLTMGADEPAWAAIPAQTSELLSATHTDTTVHTVVRGDLIVGRTATPKWTALAKGNVGDLLTMGADEPSWAVPSMGTHEVLSATHSDSTAHTIVRGDIIIASGTPAKWTALAKGTSGYFLKMGADEPAWSAHGLTYSDVGALAAGGTAVDSDKLDGQHGSYYAVAGGPPAAHVLDGVLHTVSGLTPGHFLKASGVAAFGFAAHGLSYGDVGAAAASHVHAWTDITSGVPSTWTPIAHDVLSAYHGDTTAAAVQRGDLIVGIGSTPKWERLTKGGASTYLKSDGTDVGWAGIAWGDVNKTGSSLADLATRAVANLSDGSNVALLNAANTFVALQTIHLGAAGVQTCLELKNPYAGSGTHGVAASFRGYYKLVLISAIGVPQATTGGDLQLQTYSDDSTLNVGIYLTRLGSVGIGTTSPGSQFSVLGDSDFGNSITNLAAGGYLTRLSSKSITDGAAFYGSYGALLFHATQDWATTTRRYLITNALEGNKFAIIRSVNTTTDPALGTNAVVSSGTADFVIDNAGQVAMPSLGAFVASDKYVVIDASGNLHKSALGPAS